MLAFILWGATGSCVCDCRCLDAGPEDAHILRFKGGGLERPGLSLFNSVSPPGTDRILSRIHSSFALSSEYYRERGLVFGYFIRASWRSFGLSFRRWGETFWDKGTTANSRTGSARAVSSALLRLARWEKRSLSRRKRRTNVEFRRKKQS